MWAGAAEPPLLLGFLSDLSSEDDMVDRSAWLLAKRARDLFGLWGDILATSDTFFMGSKKIFVELILNVVVSAGFLSMWEKRKRKRGVS